jgi:hypothetical protein
MTAVILLVLNLGASLLQRKLRGRVEFEQRLVGGLHHQYARI